VFIIICLSSVITDISTNEKYLHNDMNKDVDHCSISSLICWNFKKLMKGMSWSWSYNLTKSKIMPKMLGICWQQKLYSYVCQILTETKLVCLFSALQKLINHFNISLIQKRLNREYSSNCFITWSLAFRN
jgi:hypothetical protein